MSLIKITTAKEFICKLTGGKLTEQQNNRAVAYLRAKGQVFYDNWSKDHCILIDGLDKSIVLQSLQSTL